MKNCRSSKAYNGYTLVELSVVISIIAVLVGGTLIIGSARIDQEKVDSSKQRMDLIERALKNYIEVNESLPCPADPRLLASHANYGLAASTPGNCTTGAIQVPHASGKVVSGAVPVSALALPADVMYDGWGRKFTYVVDTRYTVKRSFRYNRQNSLCGSITVLEENGDAATDHGMYLLLSHGKDGHGAYPSTSATRVSSRVTNVNALDNAGLTSAGADAFDNVFRVQGYYEDVDDLNNRFDDIVTYKNRSDLRLTYDIVNENFSINSKTTIPGWAYVPEHTLPSGKVVPAFEVMKYLASDNGDGVAVSVPGSSAWENIVFSDARQACQRLGSAGINATGDGAQMEYDVIADSQWLSIAHQAILDSRNWVDSCWGDTTMVSGHNDNNPSYTLNAPLDDSDPYAGTGNSATDATIAQRAQRRTTYLPNGAIVWDLTGNLNQWSFCDLNYAEGENAYRTDLTNGAETSAYHLCLGNGETNAATFGAGHATGTSVLQYNSASGIEADDVDGKLIDLLPPFGLNDLSSKTGVFSPQTFTDIGGLTRGSSYDSPNSGLFKSRPSYNVTSVSPYARGFRCVRNFVEHDFSPRNLTGLTIWYDASDVNGDFVEDLTQEAVEDVSNDESGITTHDKTFVTSGSPCNTTNNRCISKWTNKAGNDLYHLRGGFLNASFMANSNRPTLKLNSMNGRPTVNLNKSNFQLFDTYHGRTTDADNGVGFHFNNIKQMSIFMVVNGSDLTPIIAVEDPRNAHTTDTIHPFIFLFPFSSDMYAFYSSSVPSSTSVPGHVAHTPNYVVASASVEFGGTDAPKKICGTPIGSGTYCRRTYWYTSTTNVTNASCIQLGGITDSYGLTHNEDHIATLIWNAGAENGVVAYVDGGTSDALNSAVTVKDESFVPSTQSCTVSPSGPVLMKMSIGGMRWIQTVPRRISANADIAEIIIYNRPLTNKERVDVEKYLAEKYNITYHGPGGVSD